MYKFNTIQEAIGDIQKGKMIVVVDDEDRENEGDLVMAAEKVTPAAINFMAKYGGGLICLPVVRDRLEELHIERMVAKNTDPNRTAFTVSIDASECTTGISAQERSMTIRRVIDTASGPKDFTRPGHIFPIEYREGGVLVRAGHTEASVDLAKFAGLYPAGVICEIMNEDGTMARVPELMEYCKKHHLKIITIASLIDYRRKNEKLIECVSKVYHAYEIRRLHGLQLCQPDHQGEPPRAGQRQHHGDDSILVRVHSECLTGDVFGSQRCDCGEQLDIAMKMIARRERECSSTCGRRDVASGS